MFQQFFVFTFKPIYQFLTEGPHLYYAISNTAYLIIYIHYLFIHVDLKYKTQGNYWSPVPKVQDPGKTICERNLMDCQNNSRGFGCRNNSNFVSNNSMGIAKWESFNCESTTKTFKSRLRSFLVFNLASYIRNLETSCKISC